MAEKESRRNHRGGATKEESWRMNHEEGTVEEETWRRSHGGGIIERHPDLHLCLSVSVPILLLLPTVPKGARRLSAEGQRLRDPRLPQVHRVAICYYKYNMFVHRCNY